MNKKKIIGLCLIILGVTLIILPFILVPLFNTEKIWKSETCMLEPWLCRDSFSLPKNDFILNKYDVKAFNYYLYNGSGYVSFKHLATNTLYTFAVNLTVEEYSTSTTFKMIPGEYSVTFSGFQFNYELWEHGIIPHGFDLYIYLGIEIMAVTIVLVSFKYLKISRNLTPGNLLKPKSGN